MHVTLNRLTLRKIRHALIAYFFHSSNETLMIKLKYKILFLKNYDSK